MTNENRIALVNLVLLVVCTLGVGPAFAFGWVLMQAGSLILAGFMFSVSLLMTIFIVIPLVGLFS